MFRQLAFTPHIFDEDTNHDNDEWIQQFEELKREMFPREYPSRFLIVDLICGSWSATARQFVKKISDPGKRSRAQALFSLMKKQCISWPGNSDWCEDESEWAREAVQKCPVSGRHHDRCVASDAVAEKLHIDEPRLSGLSEVKTDKFWNGLKLQTSPSMQIEEQVSLLEVFCHHVGFISLSSGYFRPSPDGETSFLIELLNRASPRPPDAGSLTVDVHTQLINPENAVNATRQAESLRDVLHQRVTANASVDVRIFIWPKIRERVFLAGPGMYKDKPKARWGVYFGHIAQDGDYPPGDRTNWSILPSKDVSYWYQERYGHAESIAGPVILQGSSK